MISVFLLSKSSPELDDADDGHLSIIGSGLDQETSSNRSASRAVAFGIIKMLVSDLLTDALDVDVVLVNKRSKSYKQSTWGI